MRTKLFALNLTLAATLLLCLQAFADDSPPAFSLKWGTNGATQGNFNTCGGVALDSAGNVYVTDYNNNRIQKFDATGHFLSAWGSHGFGNGQFSQPNGICVKRDIIYVTEADGARVQQFDTSGTFLSKWGSFGTNTGQFFTPVGIAADDDGNVYVADQGNYRIQKFDSSGNFLKAWGTQGTGNGQFVYISGLAIDAAGVLYSIDQGNGRIQEFDLSGNYLGVFAGYSGLGIAYSRGAIYVSQRSSILKLDGAGNMAVSWGVTGAGDGQLNWPFGLAMDPTGTQLFVADSLNNRIQVFQFSPPAISAQPTNQSAIAGNSVSFGVTATGSQTLFYQWQKNGANLSGSTLGQLILTNISQADAGSYRVVITNNYGAVTSSVAALMITDPPAITSQPASQAKLLGGSATFSVLATGTPPLSYQWRKNGADMANATGSSLTITNLQVSDLGSYSVLIRNAGSSIVSSNALLTINTPPVADPQAVLIYQNNPQAIRLTASCFNSGSTGLVFQIASNPAHGTLSGKAPYLTYTPNNNYLGLDAFAFNVSDGYMTSATRTISLTVTNIPWGGKFQTLYKFARGPAGAGTLVQGPDGSFYGTAGGGYADDGGNTLGVVFKTTPSGTTTVLHYFTTQAQPSDLTCGSDGNFYGTCSDGTIYKITPDGVYVVMATLSNASFPSMLTQGGDGNFYGATFAGGSSGLGTVFRMAPDGTLATLAEFNGVNGAQPMVGLTPGFDGNLYGVTAYGGALGHGTFFKVDISGRLTVLAASSANSSASRLTQGRDGNLYGTIAYSGGANYGSIFKLTTNGVFSIMASFNGYQGQDPRSGVIQASDNSFYGVTSAGGGDGGGILFKMYSDGTLMLLANFKPSAATGYAPTSGLVQGKDGFLYGTTSAGGGALQGGAVYKTSLDGALSAVSSFTDNGVIPASGLLRASDTCLYGTTTYGGTNDQGAIFKITPAGVLSTVASFGPVTGISPKYSLIQSRNGYIYGTTRDTIFRLEQDGTITVIATAAANLLSGTISGLIEGGDGNFYATSSSGGVRSRGTVFRVAPSGAVTVLASFLGPNGRSPMGGLSIGPDGATFYGATLNGGINDLGTVFKVTSDGILSTMYSFDSSASSPRVPPVFGVDGNLYGTTASGGTYGSGIIYKLTPGGVFSVVASFNQSTGATCVSRLLPMPDGSIYGLTSSGGTGAGNLFKVTPTGALINVLSLTGATGTSPQAELIRGADGALYGTTSAGGQGFGTVFRFTPLQITLQPVGETVALGAAVRFSASATGTNVQYQWTKNGTAIAGATGTNLILTNIKTTDAADYAASISDPLETEPTFAATLTIATAPSIVTAPANQIVGVGSNAVFNVVATGTAPLSYQWYRDGLSLDNGGKVSGAQAASLTLSGVTPEDIAQYSVSVFNMAGFTSSSNVTLTVFTPPAIVSAPVSQTVGAGSNVMFSVTATGTDPLAYQWFKGALALSNGANVAGATSPNLTLTGLSQADAASYSVVVSNFAGIDGRTVALVVVDPPLLISQPAPSLSIGAGSNAIFHVTVAGSAPLVYQWFKGASRLGNGGNIAGANSDSLTLSGVRDADAGSYWLSVSNLAGSVSSLNLALTVIDPPVITLQPLSQTNRLGDSVTFTVRATGTAPMTYQWRQFGFDLFGADGDSLTISGLTDSDASDYTVFINNAAGSVTSLPATLTITHPPVIAVAPASQTASLGGPVCFNVGVNGLSPFTYQWQKNGANLAGATIKALLLPQLASADEGSYTVVVKNADGSVTSAPPALLTVIGPPAIVSQPANQTCHSGGIVALSVTAAGRGLAYQWLKDGVSPGTIPGRLFGAQSNVLTLINTSSTDAGLYSVIVSNQAGVVASQAASLTVIAPLVIATQPADKGALAGQDASLSVGAEGPLPLSYQWRFGAGNIAGGTGAALLLSQVNTNQAGLYSVVVSDNYGSITSRVANLTVYSTAAASLKVNYDSQGLVSVDLVGVPGLAYGLFGSTNFTDWVLLQTNASPFNFAETNSIDHKFYRSVYLPQTIETQ